jgi:hypothetical protein
LPGDLRTGDQADELDAGELAAGDLVGRPALQQSADVVAVPKPERRYRSRL